jgi:formylglycine-generating enzyme
MIDSEASFHIWGMGVMHRPRVWAILALGARFGVLGCVTNADLGGDRPDGGRRSDGAAVDVSTDVDHDVANDGSRDVETPESGTGEPPSCAPGGAGMTNCGAGAKSCCTSLEVKGGTFFRTYTNCGGVPSGTADPATVSTFRLDQYAVTVGRFRQFVKAWKGGWKPAEGSGKHTYINGGQGLSNSGSGPLPYETGWLASYDGEVASTYPSPDAGAPYGTWSGGNDNRPMNNVNWYEAYAFCIWDGGFLPSEAEWAYAAAGGSEQRLYPWGSAAPGTACPGNGCGYAIYNCDYPSGTGTCSGVTNIAPVGTASLGAGAWQQYDMAGSLVEWNLDWFADYADPCTDCAYLKTTASKVLRGSSYEDRLSRLPASYRLFSDVAPDERFSDAGFRCGRAP